jgi:heme A synthase
MPFFLEKIDAIHLADAYINPSKLPLLQVILTWWVVNSSLKERIPAAKSELRPARGPTATLIFCLSIIIIIIIIIIITMMHESEIYDLAISYN